MKNILQLNILLIEDNPGDQVLIEDYLLENMPSNTYTIASSFSEAERLFNSGEIFDVILLDISLPDRNGKDLIEDVIKLCKGALVIVLTGYENLDFSILSLSLGVADYLVKDDINGSVLFKSIIYNLERRRTNRQLIESERKYSELFHLSPQPMWIFDIETLRFLDINQQAINHYGYTKDEFLSMTVKDIRPEEDFNVLENALRGVVALEKPHRSTYRHVKKNGEIIYVDLASDQVIFNGKKARIVVVNDITEINRYIKTIQDQNEKFREIAWTQSHIVRAPLARMMSLIELIQNPATDFLEKAEYLKLITLCGNELDQIIRDISQKTFVSAKNQ